MPGSDRLPSFSNILIQPVAPDGPVLCVPGHAFASNTLPPYTPSTRLQSTERTNVVPLDAASVRAITTSATTELRDSRTDTFTEIITSQSAPATLKQYMPKFLQWHDFATAHNAPSIPKINSTFAEKLHLTAVFNLFILDQYAANRDKKKSAGLTGRAAANAPGTFEQMFYAINHVVVKLYGREPIDSPLRGQATTAYRQNYSRPTKKAKALLGAHVRILALTARALRLPWLSVVARAIVIMWSTAGRWSCINRIDIGRTMGHPAEGSIPANPDPEGRYSFTYWYGRKNKKELTATTCPTVPEAVLDSRQSFLWLVKEFNRNIPAQAGSSEDFGILPELRRNRHGGWDVVPDPTRRCTYRNFLLAFRDAMRIAGLEEAHNELRVGTSAEWSLHGPRRGFVHEARSMSNGEPLLYEVLSLHGAWSMQSLECMMGYNSVSPAEHAATIRDLMHASLLGSRKRPRED